MRYSSPQSMRCLFVAVLLLVALHHSPCLAAASDGVTEIMFVRGCDDPASVDARETTGCFFVDTDADSAPATLPKRVKLSLQGEGLPTDLRHHRVLLQEYHRPSMLGGKAGTAAGPSKTERILLLCENPAASPIFPAQLITCEVVNPMLTMNSSAVWRPHLARLVDRPMWFDVQLEKKGGEEGAYHPLSVLRRAVQLRVTNVSRRTAETGDEMLKRQRHSVSWEAVRKHPLERLYSPLSSATTRRSNTTSSPSSAGSGDDNDESGEEAWVGLGIGGLKRELRSLFRRVFLSRLPSLAPLAEALQLQHVRGVILYGPPGNGKTLIARNLFRLLGPDTRLSVVNAADILSKFVGESEKNLRDVFEGYDIGTSSKAEDAEKDGSPGSGTARKPKARPSGTLQVLVIDEFEALFRRRGHSGDESSAKAVYDGVTNTLLSLMDGMSSRNDLLVVGLTNRLQAIDQALLRPGRFEVLIEIPAPDVPGREDIFFIHTDRLREHGFLGADVDLHSLALEAGGFSGSDIAGTVRSAVSYALLRYRKEGIFGPARVDSEEAAAAAAAGMGEELGHRPGDVGGAGAGGIGVGEGAEADASSSSSSSSASPPASLFQVSRADFDRAMKDIRSAKDEGSALSQLSADGDGAGAEVVDYDGTVSRNLARATAAMERVMRSDRTLTGLVAITGAPGTGKSTAARALTRAYDFTTVRYFSCRRLAELRDREEQLARLRDALSEASHTERGLVVLDDYDVLVDSMGSGGYAAMTLRGLLYEYMHRPGGVSRALIADSPLTAAEDAGGEAEAGNMVVNAGSRLAAERNHRVLVLTSTLASALQSHTVDTHLRVHPVLQRGAAALLGEYRVVDAAHASGAAAAYPVSMSFRTFLRVTDMALQRWVRRHDNSTAAATALPAYFATTDTMRGTYAELAAAQREAKFYAVATDAAARGFAAAVRATVGDMGLLDPYQGWRGEGSDAELEDGTVGDEAAGEDDWAEETDDVDTMVGAADEVLW